MNLVSTELVMLKDDLFQRIEEYKNSDIFQYYLLVRDRVLDMIEIGQARADNTSLYWLDELKRFEYMLDASPLIIQKLREHCFHLTGIRSYEYRGHHIHQREKFAKMLQVLRQQDQRDLFVPEPDVLGSFDHIIDEQLVNYDTLRFYGDIIAMDRGGILDSFRENKGKRKIVLEIGAGWGGFAYAFKTLFHNTSYVIFDLPQTLLFTAVYLRAAFPSASILLFGDKPQDVLLENVQSYDFILLPHYFFENIHKLKQLDLAINIASFQEMTTEQVDRYASKLADAGCASIFSYNRNRSPHNPELTTVSSILEKYYQLVRVTGMVDVYHNDVLSSTAFSGRFDAVVNKGKNIIRNLIYSRPVNEEEKVTDYRYLVGHLNSHG
jgi:putative sugar O-methyltransferase